MSRGCFVVLMAWIFAGLGRNVSFADVITLTSGRVIQGTVLLKDVNEVIILADYGTVSVPHSSVQRIEVETDKHPTTLSTNKLSIEPRFPEWRAVVAKLTTQSWARKLQQIPATVITNGVLRNVPYISFRCSVDYELNIYGDLDNPAGIEIGIYRGLLSQKSAQDQAIRFFASVLLKQTDREAVQKLNREKDEQVLDGLTLEITPATAPDAYGGWWVSAYYGEALDDARVSD